MNVLDIITDSNGDKSLMFHCPGCKEYHSVFFHRIPGSKGPTWGWNNDMINPTFTPSLLVRSVSTPKVLEKYENGDYVLQADGRIKGAKNTVCHSFIRNGMIQFLSDCTHSLKSQTIPIPPFS